MDQPQSRTARRLLEVAVVFFWASEYCHAPYFTPYLHSLQMGSTLVGIIISCYGFTQMLVRIPLGIFTDTTGAYKKIITVGLFCTTVSSLGLFLTTNFVGILLFRMLAGVAASTWIATTVVYMAMFSEAESVRASARLNALNNGGKLLAFVLGGAAATLLNYRITLFMSFAVGLVGLVVMPFVTVPAIRRTPLSLSRLGAVFTDKRILIPSLLMAVQQMILHSTVFSFTSNLAESRLSIHAAILFGFALQFVYLAVLALAPNAWVILAGQVACAFGGAILASLLLAECVSHVSQGERSTVVGVYQAVYGLGMTIGPMLFGRWMDSGSPARACFLLLGLCAVLVAALFCIGRDCKK